MSARSPRKPLNVALAVGLAVFIVVSLMHLPGLLLGLGYLGPAVFVFVLLWLGRYPGARLLTALARPRRRRPNASACPLARQAVVNLPRGGSLLASALAGRAPPPEGRLIASLSVIYSGGTTSMRTKTIAALLASTALLAPAGAQAHVSLHPNTIPAGAFATLDVRVPGEQEGAYVKKVDVLFPHGFTGVDYENVPGWSTKIIEGKLATPIQEEGETIDTEVSQIVWTWTGPLGKVENGQFIQFPLSLAVPDGAAGKALEFRTVQTYSNGQVVHWIEPALSAEHPSPRINVTAKGGVIQDIAGDEAGPRAGQTPAAPAAAAASTSPVKASSSGASKGLGIAALIIGALGLIAGLGALATQRRKAAAA